MTAMFLPDGILDLTSFMITDKLSQLFLLGWREKGKQLFTNLLAGIL